MRLGVTLNLGGAYQPQEHPLHQHYTSPPPTAAMGWKSPVPYLFGGLAAMLGLIAFALLILACSYWKLSGYLDPAGEDSGDLSGDGKPKDAANATTSKCQDSILVIMAGEATPTFVATPAISKAFCVCDSEGGNKGGCSSGSSSGGGGGGEDNERDKAVATTRTTTTTGIGDDEEEKR